jgi:hypothetical protein
MTFIQTPLFVSDWRRMRLTDEDLRALEQMLMENPKAGKVMARTGGVRKVRFAPPSRHVGKSGACRVCYTWFPEHATIGLFIIYPKNEQDTLSAADEKACRTLVARMKSAIERE